MQARQPDGPPPLRDFRPPAGTRVYAVGDIHGRADLLHRLHRAIYEDSRRDPPARQVIVYLGDYVDRGPDSFDVVESLLHDVPAGLEPVFLKGNHEQFLLDALQGAGAADVWLVNGGRQTLESYGLEIPFDAYGMFRRGAVGPAFRELVPDSHRRFFDTLAPWHVEGDYLFVHAGIRPGLPLDRQSEGDLLWIRGRFLDADDDHGHMVVHGHTINPEPDVRPNRIGIDTGAFTTGRLTCLVLEDGDRRILQT